MSHMVDNEWLVGQTKVVSNLATCNEVWKLWAQLGVNVLPLLQSNQISMANM
jgi:hypothetical protein